jgi:peptidoglycan hydrolase CwlO-like protein
MRRPGRPRVSVERSTGVAEHHIRTVLTRLHLNRFIAVACIAALGLVPATAAHASTASDRLANTTRAVDAAAQRWFTAQADASRLSASISDIEQQIATAEKAMESTRRIATARAVIMYKNSDIGLSSIFGENALDSARRAHLVNDANAGGDAAIDKLTAVVDDLNAQRRQLKAQQTEQQKVLREVATERTTLDAELASVRVSARKEARVAASAARNRAARARAGAHLRALTSVRSPDVLAAPTGPAINSSVGSVVVAAPVNNGRVSPHHNDPFLVCTRARESAGRYDVVSPSGYYGAYQFLPSTWDTTAVHAGRFDLVGVLPSRASQFDQDEVAWALYQWQGKSPWGGRC